MERVRNANSIGSAPPRLGQRRLAVRIVRAPHQLSDLAPAVPRRGRAGSGAIMPFLMEAIHSTSHSAGSEGGLANILRYSTAFESCRSMNIVKARALALACRPVGNTAQSSPGGNDQSSSTIL